MFFDYAYRYTISVVSSS